MVLCDRELSGKLEMDTGLLRINSENLTNFHQRFTIFTQSTECYKCPLVPLCSVNFQNDSGYILQVNSTFPTRFLLKVTGENQTFCRYLKQFGEYGEYNLTIFGNQTCEFYETKESKCSFLPILYGFLFILLGIFMVFAVDFGLKYWRRIRVQEEQQLIQAENDSEDGVENIPTPPTRQRLQSLDSFRGLSIVLMIFVNYGGGGYWFFAHSAWNGITVADLVFPWFMFIMGTSMAFSQKHRENASKRCQFWRIIKRSTILFELGMLFISGSRNDMRSLRFMGVLQRFDLCYFAVASLQLAIADFSIKIRSSVELFFTVGIIIIHSCLTFLLEVPGCPKGYLGPGGLSENLAYANCTGGAAAYLDRLILGPDHMFQHPTAKWTYNTNVPFDPEGLLGILTSIVTVILGLQAGKIFINFSAKRQRLIRIAVWTLITGLFGGILCKFSQNSGWIPVNKNLWSLSFVFVLASMAFALLAVFYLIIDEYHWWNGTPFYQAGMNSILLYCGHEIFEEYLLFKWTPLPDTHLAHLAQDAWGTFVWILIALFLHKKKFYFSV